VIVSSQYWYRNSQNHPTADIPVESAGWGMLNLKKSEEAKDSFPLVLGNHPGHPFIP
jgi:hypothetical protein